MIFRSDKKIIAVALATLGLAAPVRRAVAQPGGHTAVDVRVHDPSLIKAGDTYYLFSTGRGIPVKTSTDRVHWENARRVFPDSLLPAWHREDIPSQDGNLWAPDISEIDGKYYLYYAVSAWMNFHSSIGLAVNATLDPRDPRYHWEDRGMVISFKDGGDGVNVIDPNLFRDTDGKTWLVYGSFKAGIRLVRIDPGSGMPADKQPRLYKLTGGLGEGSCLLKGPGYYYLLVSTGRCCAGVQSTYHVVMGRARRIEGPYLNMAGESMLDNKASLLLEGDAEEPGRGGNSVFTEGDTTFIVYHAYSRARNGMSVLRIKPLYANQAGWPTLEATGTLFRRTDAGAGFPQSPTPH